MTALGKTDVGFQDVGIHRHSDESGCCDGRQADIANRPRHQECARNVMTHQLRLFRSNSLQPCYRHFAAVSMKSVPDLTAVRYRKLFCVFETINT